MNTKSSRSIAAAVSSKASKNQNIVDVSPQTERPKKKVGFVGAALDDFKELPKDVVKEVGRQVRNLQFGHSLDNVKPMSIVGAGTYELIVDMNNGWFRVFYVTKHEEAIYILHSFQKKTNKTSKQDIRRGQERYAEMTEERQRLKEE